MASQKASKGFPWRYALIFGVVALLAAGFILNPSRTESQITTPVPGDPGYFDPVASASAARQFAGPNSKLISMVARNVRSDGTMDLTAVVVPNETDYQFIRPVDAPTRVPTSPGQQWYQPINVSVSRPGEMIDAHESNTHSTYYNAGMQRNLDNPLPRLVGTVTDDPRCSFQQLWKVALQMGAPANALAVISYDHTGYHFAITGTRIYLSFDLNCQLQ